MHKYKVIYSDLHHQRRVCMLYAITEEQASTMIKKPAEIISIRDLGKIQQIPKRVQQIFRLNRLSCKELADILRNISYTRQSGLPVIDSFAALSTSGTAKQVLFCSRMIASLQEGVSLAEAFAREKAYLPIDISGVISSSAKANNLNDVLMLLADQLEMRLSVSSRIRSAMLYPGFILCMAVVAAWFLFTSVIPQVAAVVQSINSGALSDTTSALLGFSDFLQQDGWIFILIPVAILFCYIVFTKTFRKLKDKAVIHLPLTGNIIRNSELSQYISHLGFLLSAGFTSIDAIDSAALVVTNQYLQQQLHKSSTALLAGAPISEALYISGLFTSLEIQMISTGERAGDVPSICRTLSTRLSESAEHHLHNMLKLLEPAIMLMVGVLVGFILLAVYEPLLEMMSLI